MAEKELGRGDVIRQLWKIACSRPSAAVALAYLEQPSREIEFAWVTNMLRLK